MPPFASDNSSWAASSSNPISADYDAGIIEEVIEQSPTPSVAVTSELPSWWTDDDKSQFEGDSKTSAATSTPWNLPSAERATEDFLQTASGAQSDSFQGEIGGSDETEIPSTYASTPAATAWSLEAADRSGQTDDAANGNGATIAGIPFGEIERGGDERKSESEELDSLLARFGLARQTATETESNPEDASGNIANAMSYGLDRDMDESRSENRFQSEDRYASADLEDLPTDASEEENSISSRFEEPIEEPADALSYETTAEPTARESQPNKSSLSSEEEEGDEEESIEDYMKRLMARMRGDSDKEETKPAVSSTPTPPAARAETLVTPQSPKQSQPTPVTERANSTTTPFNPEEYVPKALAPEKSRNLAAMRELANNSARSAIQVSARRRYGTAIALKLAIALTGLLVGGTLIMINGFNVNIALIATIASFLVAVIWGIDAVGTIKPLLYTAKTTEADKMAAEKDSAKE